MTADSNSSIINMKYVQVDRPSFDEYAAAMLEAANAWLKAEEVTSTRRKVVI